MVSELKRHQEILNSYYNHNDVLLLALAFLPEGVNRLTADAGRWGQVVEKLKVQFGSVAPRLLAGFHFVYRLPLPPHSDQLDDFFLFAGISGKLEWSPADNSYFLSERVKRIIREQREHKLIEYKETIQLISQGLQTLAV